MPPIYLDYNASTPVDPRVFDAMRPWLTDEPGNAGSRTHSFGRDARDAVEKARLQIADVLAADPTTIVFTSGATESCNLAILGLAQYGEATGRRHIISTAIEHKAVLEPLAKLRVSGFDVELVPITRGGFVEAEAIVPRVRPDTLLVSIMHANNETGVLQPIAEVGEMLVGSGILIHVDAAQTFGKQFTFERGVPCDLLSITAHKIYGPKGVGALCIRTCEARRALNPIMYGGGQERGLRPGTLAVPLIVGFGAAAALANLEHRERNAATDKIKQRFLADLAGVEHFVNGDQCRCQPHVINISFPGIDSEALMMALRDDVAISNGSACTSASYEPSHVLKAMGLAGDLLESAVRISWGPGVTSVPAAAIIEAVNRLKPARPLV
jgi:cysteine desulfurase